MAFPWDTLITAGFTVGGTLGGVWLKGLQDAGRDRRLAKQEAESARTQKQEAAYVDLVVTARQALRNMRQRRMAYAANNFDQPEVQQVFAQADRLADELGRVVATVEIVGTAASRASVQAVHEGAKEVSEFYTARSLALEEVQQATGRSRAQGLAAFDADKAKALCDALSDAIDGFIAALRQERPGIESAKPRDTPEIPG
jgi:Zn-dependent oligopeptidase